VCPVEASAPIGSGVDWTLVVGSLVDRLGRVALGDVIADHELRPEGLPHDEAAGLPGLRFRSDRSRPASGSVR
jgi:hypothetical protein